MVFHFTRIVLLFEACLLINAFYKQDFVFNSTIPIIMVTWDYKSAADIAWDTVYNRQMSALDAVEKGCSICEQQQCEKTVGFGGSPDESGETTLDAMIMDGVKMDIGAVGGLRDVKSAISVARRVLENTKHSLLGGDLATDFAVKMKFQKESLQTNESREMWTEWKANNCQPNFWKNVVPDPTINCGPYSPQSTQQTDLNSIGDNFVLNENEDNHDTIGVLAIDSQGHTAVGVSTNGLKHKIPGRIGDSPIPGAGGYADQSVGAAASTGDGDIMMRFLSSFLAVEAMRHGATPKLAARKAINRIVGHYPDFFGAVIALNKKGEYGAACNGMKKFPYYVANPSLEPTLLFIECSNSKQ